MRASEAVQIARGEIGNKEYPANSNNIKYNTWYYGKEVNGSAYPWCCVFVEWVLRNTGLLMRTASCTALYNSMKSKGQVVTKPQAGDLVFFNFSSKVKCETMKHIGIVESVNNDGSVSTIEGNTSQSGSQDNGGMVCRKKRKSYIMAYARPEYTDAIKTTPVVTTTPNRPTLKLGSVGNDVLYLHKKLHDLKYGVKTDSNIYSDLTKQCVMHFQKVNGLAVDGICGANTWRALEK